MEIFHRNINIADLIYHYISDIYIYIYKTIGSLGPIIDLNVKA